jgi:predicted MFS family arabinose efflux permease
MKFSMFGVSAQLIGWRFLQGLATPGVFAITIVYIHEQWPRSHVGRATAAYVSGTVIGGFCGRATAGVVAAQAGWPSAFVTLAVLNVVAAGALWVWLPADRRTLPALPSGGGGRRLRALLTNGQLVATDAVGFCVLFTQVAMFTYVTFHLSRAPFSLSTATLGSLFVVYLVGAAMTPIAGRVIDRFGHRTGLAGAIAIGITGALLTLAPALPVIVAGLALVATGVFMAQAAASSHIGEVTAHDRGLAVGLYATSYYLGGSFGGALPAALWERGGWPACVVLVVCVQALTVALAWGFWDDRRGAEPPLVRLE